VNTVAQRLRTRLAIIGLVAMLPAVGAILYTQSTEREAAAQRTIAENRRLLRLAAEQQSAVFEGSRQLLRMLADYPAIRTGNQAHYEEVLHDTLANHSGYYNIAVIDSNGMRVCAAVPVANGDAQVARRRQWFKIAAQRRDTVVGGYQISETVGKPTIIVAQPVFDGCGAVTHIVAAAIAIARLNELAADAEIPDRGALTMFDRTGTVVARYPEGDRWTGHTVPTPALERAVAASATGAPRSEEGLDGVKRLVVTAPVHASIDTGLFLALGVERESAFAAANGTVKRYLWLLGFVSVAAVGAALAVGHLFVVKPVIDLSDASHRTARELRDAEGRYQQLFDNNPNPMWAYDRVHSVGDPAEALEYAAASSHAIDMVFTDVVLPGISGPAMVTEMQARHPDARVLYMSGYVDHSILPGGLIRPGIAFLQKPFTAEALTNKIRDVLDSQHSPVA
jgi:CheY-like chemotaxis protein